MGGAGSTAREPPPRASTGLRRPSPAAPPTPPPPPPLHAQGALLERTRRLVLAVRSRVASAFGLAPRHVVPVEEAHFHRTTSGKIQRGAFQRGLLDGAYATALRALDLALGTSELAVPDYLTAPQLVESAVRPVSGPRPVGPPGASQDSARSDAPRSAATAAWRLAAAAAARLRPPQT